MIPSFAIDIVTLIVLAVGFGFGWWWRGWSDRAKARDVFQKLSKTARADRDP